MICDRKTSQPGGHGRWPHTPSCSHPGLRDWTHWRFFPKIRPIH